MIHRFPRFHRLNQAGFLFCAICVICGLALGQETAKPVLTELEQTKIELVRTKKVNAVLQFQALQAQIEQLKAEYPKLDAEERALLAEIAKAHGIDPKTHRLNKDGTGFEPMPTKAEVKKQ